jgi:hypothetical protein
MLGRVVPHERQPDLGHRKVWEAAETSDLITDRRCASSSNPILIKELNTYETRSIS